MRKLLVAAASLFVAACYTPGNLGPEPFMCDPANDAPECPDGYVCYTDKAGVALCHRSCDPELDDPCYVGDDSYVCRPKSTGSEQYICFRKSS